MSKPTDAEAYQHFLKVARDRMAAGQCRHCGGPVPCASAFGDAAIGRRHGSAPDHQKKAKEKTR